MARSLRTRYVKFWHSSLRPLLLLLPCGMITLVVGGQLLAAVAVVGLISAYVFDALGLDAMGYAAIWLTLIASITSLCASWAYSSTSSLLDMFVLLNFSSFLLLVGFWSSIQLEFFVSNFPELMAVFKRVVYGCLCFPASGVLMTAGVAAFGVDHAAYVLLIVLFIALYVCFSPRQNDANKTEKVVTKPNSYSVIQSSLLPDFADPISANLFLLHLAVFQLLPAVFHWYLHKNAGDSFFLQDLILLLCLPSLLCHIFWDEIWQFHPFPAVRTVRRYLVLCVAVVALAAVEYRLVLATLTPYLYYHFSYPLLSWILVTITAYAGVCALILIRDCVQGKDETRLIIFRACVYVATLTGSLALGMPIYLLPFSLAAAFAFLRFLIKQDLELYLIFVATSTLLLSWFVYRSFWFLDVEFYYFGLKSMSLRCFAVGVVLLGGVFLLAPGVLVMQRRALSDGVIALLATGLTLLEFILFQQNSEHESDVYPLFLIWLTSIIGVSVASKLRGLVDSPVQWLVMALFLGKIAIGFVTGPLELVGVFILVVEFGLLSRFRLQSSMLLVHCSAIFSGLFLTRHAVLDRVLALFITLSPTHDLGIIFPAFFTLVIGLVFSNGYLRLILSSLVAVLSLVIIQSGAFLGFRFLGNSWVFWTVVLLFIAGWLAFQKNRTITALLWGACSGLLVCSMSTPAHLSLYGLYVLIFLLFTELCLLLSRAREDFALPLVFLGCVFIFPIALLELDRLYGQRSQEREALRMAQTSLLGTLACLHFAVSLLVKQFFATTYLQRGVGNIAAVTAVLLGLFLIKGYQGGNDICIFVLSPTLLLMSHQQHRYLPVWACTVAFLCFTSLSDMPILGFWDKIIESLCLIGCLPLQGWLFQFLKTSGNLIDSDFWLVCVAPLSGLALCLTSLWSVRLLALTGLISAPVALTFLRSVRRRGMNII